jgi:hypothetical protein
MAQLRSTARINAKVNRTYHNCLPLLMASYCRACASTLIQVVVSSTKGNGIGFPASGRNSVAVGSCGTPGTGDPGSRALCWRGGRRPGRSPGMGEGGYEKDERHQADAGFHHKSQFPAWFWTFSQSRVYARGGIECDRSRDCRRPIGQKARTVPKHIPVGPAWRVVQTGVGLSCVAQSHNGTQFIVAKVSTTVRLLTRRIPMPG